MKSRKLGRAKAWVLVALGSVFLLVAPPASAQLSAGVDASYNNDVVFGSWGFGGRVGVQLPPVGFARMRLVGAGVWYVPSCAGGNCKWWEAQGMALFSPRTEAPVAPYLGLGTSYHTFEVGQGVGTTHEWGIDFLFGTHLGIWGILSPYAEVRYKVMTGDVAANQFVFTFGLGIGG